MSLGAHLAALMVMVMVPGGVLTGCAGSGDLPPDQSAGSPDQSIVLGDLASIDSGSLVDLGGPDRDAACGQVTVESPPSPMVVDVIFLVDNSSTMSDEIGGLEQSINDFANTLGKAGFDYRFILFSRYGSSVDGSVCVPPPLSTQSRGCRPPDAMVGNNPPRFFHYNWQVPFGALFRQAIARYNEPDIEGNPLPAGNCNGAPCAGWNQFLRRGARKVIVVHTNDKSDTNAAQIDLSLLKLDPAQWGTAKKRNYVVQSLIGLPMNNPPGKPWTPKDPLQLNGLCGKDAYDVGLPYQELSVLTGGLRFPVCAWADYRPFFEAMPRTLRPAGNIACEIELPSPPGGQQIDESATLVEYLSSVPSTEAELLTRVSGLDSCFDGAFYPWGGSVVLCPDSCERVRRDADARLRVTYFCHGP